MVTTNRDQPQLFDYPTDRPQLFDTSRYGPPKAPESTGSAPSAISEARAAHAGRGGWGEHPSIGGMPSRERRTIEDPWGESHPIGQGKQLPAFLSARQIMRDYHPLEGDRQEAYDPREGEATNRPETTAGYPNRTIRTNDRRAPFLQRQGTIGQQATHYRDFGHPESDEQLWSRKLEEAQMPKYEYQEVHGGGSSTQHTPGWETMAGRSDAPQFQQRLRDWTWNSSGQMVAASSGYARYDEHLEKLDQWVESRQQSHREKRSWGEDESLHETLSHAMRPGGEGFKGVLHLGARPRDEREKPEVFGGHHRIAIMEDIQPERLLPVIHHEQFRDARAETHYRYT